MRFVIVIVHLIQFKVKTETESTIEVEIVTINMCWHDLFPVVDLASEIGLAVSIGNKQVTKMHVAIHKNNVDASTLDKTLP